ncbi:neurosecretory protein VGF [Ambystoma mexicanum]|uniref:neurosecretory protein VGF n=1 Tax=Ambystoma mexicanum TaxID=8296 RepID=UPI0037E81993
MIWATYLQRAALILSISLLRECCLHAAPLGEEKPQEHEPKIQYKDTSKVQDGKINLEAPLESRSQPEKEVQARSLPDFQSKASFSNDEDELFKDVDPKTLAAVLLQALNIDQDKPQSPSDKRDNVFTQFENNFADQDEPKVDEDTLTEKVQSRTRSSSIESQNQMFPKQGAKAWKEEEKSQDPELNSDDLDSLTSMLQELQKYSAASKRERSNNMIDTYNNQEKESDYGRDQNNILKELEEFQEMLDQQGEGTHTNREERRTYTKERVEEKKYVREYKDLAQARRQADKKTEDDKIADIASNLLLQYLLKGEDNTDQENNGKEEAESFADETKKSNLIFDDDIGNDIGDDTSEDVLGEQDTAAEDKRSNEAEEDMDPQTIDKLIEISSKLHLPADDVIDIINDVEKKKKDAPERAEPRHKQSHRERVRTPPARYEAPQPMYYAPHHKKERSRHHMKEEPVWHNSVLGNDLDYEDSNMAMPRKYRAKQNTYSNYIRPRAFQKPSQYYYNPSASLMQREDYYDDSQDKEEELENYIEKILLKHPEVFQ